jgi:hypothetical protein
VTSDFSLAKNLTSLKLSGNLLSGTLDTPFAQMTWLVQLNLAGNVFTGSIPTVMGSFTSLKVLNLGRNLLEGTVPPSFSSLVSLVELGLQGTGLKGELPESLFSATRNLQVIRLEDNAFVGQFPLLVSIPTLKELYFSNNYFSGLPINGFQNLPVLSVIDGSNNNVSSLTISVEYMLLFSLL